MFTVALIGPDGAGKTTIARRLEQTFPVPIKYIYMGDNRDAGNFMLPTTRLAYAIKRAFGLASETGGPPDPGRVKPRPKGALKRTVAGLRSSLRLANRLGEEWFRQGMACYYQRRGKIVLFDRHFFSDYYAYDVANRGQERALTRRIHGFFLDRLYPKPDLVICLDAPAEVLFARKSEGTLEALECRRQEYLQLSDRFNDFAMVDAGESQDKVAQRVATLIEDFYAARSQCSRRGL